MRNSGRHTMQSHFYNRKPFHPQSRIARTATFTTMSETVWDRALSPWARARLHAPTLTPEADDDPRGDADE
jgi:hypothetical protein